MRFYTLTLTDTTIGKIVKTYTSHPNGKFDPGALLIEFDAIVSPYSQPIEGQSITVHGISLSDLQQAQEFTGLQLSLYGGMKDGLPLSMNQPTPGLIVSGVIWQSWGTWEGTEMKLDFILQADEFYLGNPGNIMFNWPANTPISAALISALNVAYNPPSNKNPIPIIMNGINAAKGGVLSNITSTNPENKPAPSLSVFGQWLYQITKYLGHAVQIVSQNGTLQVFDDAYKPNPIPILFSDLIGQPAWIDVLNLQIKVALRANIFVGSRITLPNGMQNAPGFVVTQGQALPSSLKYKSSFDGQFYVTNMRHVGNYKAHEGAAWVTIINCTPAGN